MSSAAVGGSIFSLEIFPGPHLAPVPDLHFTLQEHAVRSGRNLVEPAPRTDGALTGAVDRNMTVRQP